MVDRRHTEPSPPGDATTEHELAHEAARARQGPALWVGSVLGIAFAVAVAVAIAQNGDRVRFEWLTLDVDAPLWLLLVVTLALGMAAAALARWMAKRTVRHGERRWRAVDELSRNHRDAEVHPDADIAGAPPGPGPTEPTSRRGSPTTH